MSSIGFQQKHGHEETGTMIGNRARARAVLAALLCALASCLAGQVAPAGATVVHLSEGSFDGADRPIHEPFSGFQISVAADRSSGDIWVTEESFSGIVRVDEFNGRGEYAGVEITGEGTPHGQFGFGIYAPGIAAVDNSASGSDKGDLYVSDSEHGVVDRFSSSGAFQCQITATTPGSAEAIEHECNGAAGSEPSGGPSGFEPTGVAVDAAGDLYVADRSHDTIDVFGPSGQYQRQIADSHITYPGTMAVDSQGELYVTNLFSNVAEFSATGAFIGVVAEDESPTGVAVDPSNDHFYVGVLYENHEARAVAEYEPSGARLGLFDSMSSGPYHLGYFGIGVESAGKVAVAEPLNLGGTSSVSIYSPDLTIPTVTTQAATGAEEASAILHGHVDQDAAHGGGEVTSCRFEYGPTKAYGESAPCEPVPPYSSPQDVSANVTGLRPASTYHYRLEAANANGVPSYAEDGTLTTKGPPSVDLESAEALTTSVTLKARINPWGYDTTCQVQYVSDASFQQAKWADATTVPCSPEDLGAGSEDLTVKFQIKGLGRGSTYRYRFLASNQAGLAGHPESTFETYGIRKLSLEFLKNSSFKMVGFYPTEPGSNEFWEGGEAESPLQAGAHPYELVTDVIMSNTTEFSKVCVEAPHVGCKEVEVANNTAVNTKDIRVDLPPGLIGNPTAIPRCNRFLAAKEGCPSDSQVGMAEIWVDYPLWKNEIWPRPDENEGEDLQARRYTIAVYNVEPAGQNPAEFAGFIEGQAPVWIPFQVRAGQDYGVSANAVDISSIAGGISRVRVRVWGVPGAPAHEAERKMHCPEADHEVCPDTEPEVPLLRNATSCTGPLKVSAAVDSWQEPGQYAAKTIEIPGFTGCDRLKFEPTFEARPTSALADSPTGLHVDLHVPQDLNSEGHEDPSGLATADLRNARIVLPAGLVVDTSSVDGLEACSEAQIGYLPQQSAELGHPQFNSDPAGCPDAAKIGSVQIDSRLVDHPLAGGVYVAQPQENPFKSLLAIYIAVYDAPTGLVIKLPGQISPDPLTGQLTATFDENPQLPFEDFKLDLFSGSRAALTTPLTCGSYQAATDLTPWSSPEGADATPLSPAFAIAGALGGAPCVTTEALAPNAPSFEAGTDSPIAASYSPFVLRLEREDGSQHFGALDLTLPPGMSAKIAGVQECPQQDIDRAKARSGEGQGALELAHPSCPAASEIGIVHVGTGSGAPNFVTGHVYFAGPYEGAPFSLLIVTPAIAGPFDLGAVVVRAANYIDPTTAQDTIRSDPFPTILYGIPIDIRDLLVEVNRKEFTFNPTSCAPMSVTGRETSTATQSAALSDRFQAGGCTTLPFDPSFKASASVAASPKEGAALIVKVGSGPGQANIAKVHVTLPKQLPSRLTTLQKACIDTVFDQDPARCPAESKVGEASATTPLLSTPLTGPAYFVSHGGAKFPELIVVLSGEGFTIDLHGETYIDKSDVTTSTFPSVPDLPVSSFELKLPTGPYSALDSNGDLCSQKLVMPTQLTGQNGALVEQRTPIAVEGCKPEMRVLRHRVRGKHAIVVVRVPSAGTLSAGGKGLSHVSKQVRRAGVVTVSLRLSRAEQRFVARHHGRRLMAPIRLSFRPARGGNLNATVAVLMR